MSNHGAGSNHNDGSDRQIVRAVAESCGWELERIADGLDVFVFAGVVPRGEPEETELRVEYVSEEGDIYRRQVRVGGLVEGLGDVIDSLRQPLRDAWAARLEAAREVDYS